jgi:hypothetical protein
MQVASELVKNFANSFSFQVASTAEVRAAVAQLNQELIKQREIMMDPTATLAQKQAANAQIALIQTQIKAEKDKGNVIRQVGIGILKTIRDVIQAYLAQAIAAMITNEIKTKGLIGVALAAIGSGLVFAAFDSLVPKFAKGGLAYGPMLAMVGDNTNAKNDPELIAPLSKVKAMLADAGGGANEIYGVLDGNDIRLSTLQTEMYYKRKN